jgi:glycosyltransferase involved in cell wall biosynthesis
MDLRVSVIITTYNNPRALTLVLAGIRRQTVADFELLIADDGSGPETRAVVERFAADAPQAVRHIWHPDEGVRKCTILNKAIAAAAGNYLVFLDGDCIAPANWIAAHVGAARYGWFVAGGKVLLNARLTQQLTAADVAAGTLERPSRWWLDIERRRRLLVARLPVVRDLFDRNLERRLGFTGENASTFTEHVYQVRGFDERFTVGYDDADFSERLRAAGILGRSIRYTAPVCHLDHGRPYVGNQDAVRNRALFDANRAAKVIATPFGLPNAAAPAGERSGAMLVP